MGSVGIFNYNLRMLSYDFLSTLMQINLPLRRLDEFPAIEIPLLKRIMGGINRHFLDVVTAINVVDSAEFAPRVGCLVFGFQGPGNQEGT